MRREGSIPGGFRLDSGRMRPEAPRASLGDDAGNPVRSPSGPYRATWTPVAFSGRMRREGSGSIREDAPGGFASEPIRMPIRLAIRLIGMAIRDLRRFGRESGRMRTVLDNSPLNQNSPVGKNVGKENRE